MFITRATRHDRDDIRALLEAEGWDTDKLDLGRAFIARDGGVVGCARLVEVAPQTLVVDDVLVDAEKRGRGIGERLMQTLMNSRGGTLYLCCHPERVGFYDRLGFVEAPFDDLPAPVQEYFRAHGDGPEDPVHVHHYLRAR